VRLADLLDAIDAFDDAIRKASRTPGRAPEVIEFETAMAEMIRNLEVVGIKRTAHQGTPAILDYHDILGVEPSVEPPGTILRVLSQGYHDAVSGRIVRKAKVVVSGPIEMSLPSG
jgi:molecular chaperone GrpE (heat shock protein)